jgi:hypothetical protein
MHNPIINLNYTQECWDSQLSRYEICEYNARNSMQHKFTESYT